MGTVDTVDIVFETQRLRRQYIYFAIAMLFFWIPHPAVLLAGGVLLSVAIVQCYRRKHQVAETFFADHYRWLIRTFWIGTGVLMPLATILAVCIVWKYSDMEYLKGLFSGAFFGLEALEAKIYEYYRANIKVMIMAVLPTGGAVLLWWYIRLLKGYKRLKQELHLPYVGTWLF